MAFALDADFDLRIRLDVDLLKNRRIEDQLRRISKADQFLHQPHVVPAGAFNHATTRDPCFVTISGHN